MHNVGGHEHYCMCMHEVHLVPDSIHLIVFALRAHSESRSYVASSHAPCRQNKRIRGQRTVSCIAVGQACRAREPHRWTTILYASSVHRTAPPARSAVQRLRDDGSDLRHGASCLGRCHYHPAPQMPHIKQTGNEQRARRRERWLRSDHATPSRYMNRHNWQTAVPPRWRVSRAVHLTCAPCSCHQGAPMVRVTVTC